MLLQLIVYSESYHFPHKMHRRRMGSICRSFTQELAPKVWFWFAKLILKRSGSFLGKVFHHYTHFFYRFDRNVIKSNQEEEPGSDVACAAVVQSEQIIRRILQTYQFVQSQASREVHEQRGRGWRGAWAWPGDRSFHRQPSHERWSPSPSSSIIP